MPFCTLKDQDKVAWSWAEFTDPKLITEDHILTAYRIKHNFCKNKTCRRNCRGNPFCISGLGEGRLIENLKNPIDDTGTVSLKKTEGNFVGLRNLGATCYVNSLLQLWFHNKAFRDAIFSWNPHEDPVEQNNPTLYTDQPFLPHTVVGHLQQLFALMYYSKCRYIDPSSLVESLRLDTSTQQDAQEFSKLFISLLESALKHQSLQHVKDLVSQNFQGEYMYVTRCCKCLNESVSPSMFYELELNVKGHNTLMECLAEFLKEEKLEGADCYSCAVCQTKQEACRFIKLCTLPPVLNLQLLRFVYDRERGQRKKLKTVVQFPEILDMKEFVESSPTESLLYNLSAVLIHKGSRASSGHFVAYIKDGVTGTWNTFNDECVEKLEGKKLKLDEEDEESPGKQKVQRLPKGFQSSTDAYMLVYTSENHKPSLSEVKLSSRLQEYVDSQNQAFDELCEEIVSSKKQGLEKQEQLLDVYNCLSVEDTDDLQQIDVLTSDWITSWLNFKTNGPQQIDNTKLLCSHGRLDPSAVTVAKYISSPVADSLYDEFSGGPRLKMPEVLCQPCVTNTCLALRIKTKSLEESKEIANLLKKRMSVDEPGYFVDKYCLKTWRTTVLSMFEVKPSSTTNGSSVHDDASEPVTEETLPTSQNSVPASQTSVSESQTSAPASQTALNTAETTISSSQTRSSASKTTISEPCLTPPLSNNKVVSETNDNLISENGVVTRRRGLRHVPQRHSRRKQSETINVPLCEIRDCFVMCQRLQVGLIRPNDFSDSKMSSLLKQCRKLKIKLKRLTISPKTRKILCSIKKSIDNKNKDNSDENTIIAKESDFENGDETSVPFDDEKVVVKQEPEEGNKSDEEKHRRRAFNEAILCPHGNLSVDETDRRLVPTRVWEILKQYFPSAPSFPHTAEPCHSCQKLASKDEVVKQQYYENAVNQKKALSDLFHLRSRPVPGKHHESIYIIPREHFHQPWSAFLRWASRRDGSTWMEPPISLKVGMLLCEHGLLHYSPQYEEDLARLVLVNKQEWETLLTMFTTDHEVTIDSDLSTTPELCESCFAARIENEQKEKLNYERARLNIRQVPSLTALEDSESSDSAAPRKRPKTDEGSTSPIPPEFKKLALPSGDVRRSARHRKARGQKDVHFMVSSCLTLRELKQKITSQLAVAPFDQHLSTIDGKELHGDHNTLASLGILPNSTLLLQVDEPKENFDDMIEGCTTLTEPEAGFKGTGLLLAN